MKLRLKIFKWIEETFVELVPFASITYGEKVSERVGQAANGVGKIKNIVVRFNEISVAVRCDNAPSEWLELVLHKKWLKEFTDIVRPGPGDRLVFEVSKDQKNTTPNDVELLSKRSPRELIERNKVVVTANIFKKRVVVPKEL